MFKFSGFGFNMQRAHPEMELFISCNPECVTPWNVPSLQTHRKVGSYWRRSYSSFRYEKLGAGFSWSHVFCLPLSWLEDFSSFTWFWR